MAEVFVGAGAGATFVPEMDIQLNDVVFSSNVGTLHAGDQALIALVPDLYVGCRVTIGSTDTIITANTATTITVESVSDSTSDATIHGFGAPVPGPKSGSTPTLLSDHWLGLVDTFTPPNVEVEMKQLNLAVSGSRNYVHQFKGAETVSGGSLELMMNNGSWLYYALGAGTFAINTSNGTTDSWAGDTNDFLVFDAGDKIVRSIAGNEYPLRLHSGGTALTSGGVDVSNYYIARNTAELDYTFTELNGDTLPSFALEVTYDKSTVGASTVIDSNTNNVNRYCRIFTGCQVNTLTLNFEEWFPTKKGRCRRC